MSRRDQALDFLRMNGPSLPSALAKHLGSSIIIASAVLSELAAHDLVKISKLKIGGSPVYYLNGQEPMLEKLFYPRLNEKDKKTYDLLKSKKLLKNDELDPLTRVSLRNLGDFAIPITVDANGEKVLFWKWFLLSDSELKELLDNYFNPKPVIKNEQSKTSKEECLSKTDDSEIKHDNLIGKNKVPVQKKFVEFSNLNKNSSSKKNVEDFSSESELLKSAISFLKSNNCTVTSIKKVSKREFHLFVEYASPIGVFKLLCVVWDKKRFSDSDLSKVFVEAYLKKLQPVLITKGELTKKAKVLNSSFNVVVKVL